MLGNYILSTVLPQIYAQNRDPIIDCTARLMDILDQCDVSERSSLFQVFSMVAKTKPQVSRVIFHSDYKWRIFKLSVVNQTVNDNNAFIILHVYYFQSSYTVIFSTPDFGAPHSQVVGVPVDLCVSPAGSHHVCWHGRGKSEAICGLRCCTESFGGETASTSDSCCSDHGIHCHH